MSKYDPSKTIKAVNERRYQEKLENALAARALLKGKVPDEWLDLQPTTRLAKEKGETKYFDGIPCKEGHNEPKDVFRSGSCMRCKQIKLSNCPKAKAKNRSYNKKVWADPISRKKEKERTAAYRATDQGKKMYRQAVRRYKELNRAKISKKQSEWEQKKMKRDPSFKLVKMVRSRIWDALKRIGKVKDERTQKLVGCDARQLQIHFENSFTDGMSWENQGKWHIDHVRPSATFDLNDKHQWMVCFNWRNLQPLWQSENTSKQDNYTPLDEVAWVERMISLGYEGELFLKYEEGNSY